MPLTTLDLLAKTELFGHLDRSALEKVARRTVKRTFQKGQFLFTQGDPGETIFVLSEGLVKVVVAAESGDQMVLGTLEPPATFGELALVDRAERPASVEALRTSTTLVLGRVAWEELVTENPALNQGLIRSLVATIHRLTDHAADMAFLDLQGRVAKLLIRLAEEQGANNGGPGLVLPVSQGDLARMVGGSRQSINQILKQLESVGYLETQGREILLKDPDRLRRRAGLSN